MQFSCTEQRKVTRHAIPETTFAVAFPHLNQRVQVLSTVMLATDVKPLEHLQGHERSDALPIWWNLEHIDTAVVYRNRFRERADVISKILTMAHVAGGTRE